MKKCYEGNKIPRRLRRESVTYCSVYKLNKYKSLEYNGEKYDMFGILQEYIGITTWRGSQTFLLKK